MELFICRNQSDLDAVESRFRRCDSMFHLDEPHLPVAIMISHTECVKHRSMSAGELRNLADVLEQAPDESPQQAAAKA